MSLKPYPTTEAKKELDAINQVLASVGQAPVTTADSANPDVAIAEETLLYVNKEVQSEGWTFNKQEYYEVTPDTNEHIVLSSLGNILQIDLNRDHSKTDAAHRTTKEAIIKADANDSSKQKLFDKYGGDNGNGTFKWGTEAIRVDIVWLFDWHDVPNPIQDYIVARTATLVSSRIVGDPSQYQMLQQREANARANALEYECNQGDYTYFGHPRGRNSYNSYKPYHTLTR